MIGSRMLGFGRR